MRTTERKDKWREGKLNLNDIITILLFELLLTSARPLIEFMFSKLLTPSK